MQTVVLTGFLSMPGGWEWVLILAVALLIFGRNLPAVMRSLGGSVREFRKGLDEGGASEDSKPKTDDIAENEPAKPESGEERRL
jgi:sec-independent protein translocase protein TatA